MIVDVYKIVTEDRLGHIEDYTLSVEADTCQSLVTDISISWLTRSGRIAALDRPNFQYCYTELAEPSVKTVVSSQGFCVFAEEPELQQAEAI